MLNFYGRTSMPIYSVRKEYVSIQQTIFYIDAKNKKEVKEIMKTKDWQDADDTDLQEKIKEKILSIDEEYV